MGDREQRYSIIIELFDHSAPQLRERASPLWPSTPTRLPPTLDKQLRATQDKLVLPKDIWTALPSTRTAGRGARDAAVSPRAWTQSLGPVSPPAIATSSLWTPSQGDPTEQKPVLDFRFGPLTVDWVDSPAPTIRAPSMSPSLSAGNKRLPSIEQVPHTSGDSRESLARPVLSPRQPGFPAPPLGALSPPSRTNTQDGTSPTAHSMRPPERQGTTDLNWGIVHLFREAGAYKDDSTDKAKRKAMNDDDGTIVGLVSVPGVITAAAILTFISPALESIAQLRMIKDSTPNRTIVLIRFHDPADAAEFRVMYNGRAYYDTKDSEVAQVVPISSIQLKSSATPPFTFPFSPPDVVPDSRTSVEAVELPTCPICLERLDVQVSGLIQILCVQSVGQQIYGRDGAQTKTWGRNLCSRLAPFVNRKRIYGSALSVATSDGGHAHSHFDDTGHAYSLEIETGRVWSYVDDEYVHRLIRSRTDGKLVELPSMFNDGNSSDKKKPSSGPYAAGAAGTGPGLSEGAGPDERAEESQDKLEAIGLEYANLMTTQLESQRSYYEEEVAVAKDEVRVLRRKLDEALKERDKSRSDKIDAEKRIQHLLDQMQEAKKQLQGKVDGLTKRATEDEARRKKERQEWTKTKKDLEKELEQERSVTASLTRNLGSLRLDMSKQEQEMLSVRQEVETMKETMQDLMMALEMRTKIEQDPDSELAGGTISVAPSVQSTLTSTPSSATRRKKKK
ncbi:hypothetical protein OIV83_004035 [Microbotryomycetes sp. JL201]|nr:hypothetical protein OIV83_004035 [Microbotryomycetes sp. JL201]